MRRPKALIAIAALAVGAATTVSLVGCIQGPPVNTVGQVDFATALPIPPLVEGPDFALEAQEGTTEFAPGVETGTLGYNGSYLGPTLVMDRGENVSVHLQNSLEETTTLHWHGMHLPAAMDGGPHQPVAPGAALDPHWTVDQPAATLWYHPHPHGETERQVGMGLAGMVIVRDDAEAALPLPRDYGVDDLPVIVQDATLAAGPLRRGDAGFIGGLGDQLIVNGAVGPYADVTTDVVRLRLLNASPARIYQFGFSDHRDFAMIASDGGLLEAPYETPEIRLSPGERAEILVRMTPGERVVLEARSRRSMMSTALGNFAVSRNCTRMSSSRWSMPVFTNEKAVAVETYNTPVTVETCVASVWKGNHLMTPVGGGVHVQPKQALLSSNIQPDADGKVAEQRAEISLKDLAAGQWWWD